MPFFGHWYVLLLMVVFWGGLISLAVWAIRRGGRSGKADSALNILNERFARGEIDKQQYEERKAAISR